MCTEVPSLNVGEGNLHFSIFGLEREMKQARISEDFWKHPFSPKNWSKMTNFKPIIIIGRCSLFIGG